MAKHATKEWQAPRFEDKRFGFEVTMYICTAKRPAAKVMAETQGVAVERR